MAASGDSQTVSEYIVHHLTNLTYGKLPAGFERYDGSVVPEGGQWIMAHGAAESTAMGFNAIHVDSMNMEPAMALLIMADAIITATMQEIIPERGYKG